MKAARILIALFCLPAVVAAQDSTAAAPKDETLMKRIGLHGLHFSFGGGSSPYMGRNADPVGTSEVRVGATFQRWPEWTIVLASSGVGHWDTTTYVAPNSGGYHPHLAAGAAGAELQRRWSSSRLFHFTATVGAGELVNSYNYLYFPKAGGREFRKEQITSVRYATLAGGGELNVSSWARLLITAGYRAAESTRIAGGVGTNSGVVSAVLLELGKF